MKFFVLKRDGNWFTTNAVELENLLEDERINEGDIVIVSRNIRVKVVKKELVLKVDKTLDESDLK